MLTILHVTYTMHVIENISNVPYTKLEAIVYEETFTRRSERWDPKRQSATVPNDELPTVRSSARNELATF